MSAYTMITNKTVLEKANVGGTGINSLDKYIQKEFGGRIFTKELFRLKVEEYIRTRPGYGSQGGKPGYEKRKASQTFTWWEKRGVIFSVN